MVEKERVTSVLRRLKTNTRPLKHFTLSSSYYTGFKIKKDENDGKKDKEGQLWKDSFLVTTTYAQFTCTKVRCVY